MVALFVSMAVGLGMLTLCLQSLSTGAQDPLVVTSLALNCQNYSGDCRSLGQGNADTVACVLAY